MSLGIFIYFLAQKKNQKYFPSFSPPSSCHLKNNNNKEKRKKKKRENPLFADVLTNFHFDHFSLSPPSSCHFANCC
jgi:hypothetical protein